MKTKMKPRFSYAAASAVADADYEARKGTLPPLLVQLRDSAGALIDVKEMEDPRIRFCAIFNAMNGAGFTAEPKID